mmetsp:Transcript_55302/g.89433  ORF Transcript_55302/g.89433 Transcript_55302/m.89433 type:complete len:314 (+) Transcript_55302:175-1116(+)
MKSRITSSVTSSGAFAVQKNPDGTITLMRRTTPLSAIASILRNSSTLGSSMPLTIQNSISCSPVLGSVLGKYSRAMGSSAALTRVRAATSTRSANTISDEALDVSQLHPRHVLSTSSSKEMSPIGSACHGNPTPAFSSSAFFNSGSALTLISSPEVPATITRALSESGGMQFPILFRWKCLIRESQRSSSKGMDKLKGNEESLRLKTSSSLDLRELSTTMTSNWDPSFWYAVRSCGGQRGASEPSSPRVQKYKPSVLFSSASRPTSPDLDWNFVPRSSKNGFGVQGKSLPSGSPYNAPMLSVMILLSTLTRAL